MLSEYKAMMILVMVVLYFLNEWMYNPFSIEYYANLVDDDGSVNLCEDTLRFVCALWKLLAAFYFKEGSAQALKNIMCRRVSGKEDFQIIMVSSRARSK